ncbi:MAG: AAA family ATPase [Actinomycetota bacterium]|nr:AAA family ATPase [Actinomycetota bacterium]
MTILFTDLSGYTSLCASLDPEQVHLLVRPLMNGLRRLCEELGAVVPTIEGDGFMAVFGALRSDERDPHQALSAAVRLQHLVTERRSAYGSRLPQLRVGLNAGEVLVAPSWERGGFSVAGDPVNVAQRLCHAAAPGTILASAEIVRLVPEVTAWGEEAVLTLRNREQAVPARTLDWATLDPVPAAGRTVSSTPLVDRTEALALLSDLLRVQPPHAMLLVGEPGVGKSRLAEEWAGRSGRQVLRGRCPARGSAADQPFADLLHALAPWPHLGLPAIVERRARRLIGSVDTSETDSADEQFAAAVRVLAAAAQVQSLVVVVEDAHEAGPALLGSLAGLVERAGPSLAVLLTSRVPLPSLPKLGEIELLPLGRDDTSALIERLLPGSTPELAGFLARRSGGVPLYLEHCAQLLLDDGVVVMTAAGSQLVDPAGLGRVPTAMRLFVASRIDLLDADERAVLLLAAVLGDVVSPTLLAFLGGDVGDGVERLVGRGLLCWAPRGSGEPLLRFRHALVRDVAYDGQLRGARVALHERAAEWYRASGARHAAAARVMHLDAALALYDGAEETGCRLAADLLAALVDYASHIGEERPTAAAEALERAVTVARDFEACGVDTLPLELARGTTLLLVGDEQEARLAAERARAAAVARGDRGSQALADLALGRALIQVEPSLASQALAEAAELFAAAGDARGLARVAIAEAIARETSTGLGAQCAAYEQAFGAAEAAGDRALASTCAQQLALHSFGAGRGTTRHWSHISERFLRPDDEAGRARLALAGAIVDLHALDLAPAASAARQARIAGHDAGEQHVALNAWLVELECQVVSGGLTQAELTLARLMPAAEARPTPRMRCNAVLLGAWLWHRQGRLDASWEAWAHGSSLAVGLGPAYLREAQAVKAHLLAGEGRWHEAIEAARTAADLDRELDQPFLGLRPRLLAHACTMASGGISDDCELPGDALAMGADPVHALALGGPAPIPELWSSLGVTPQLPPAAGPVE